jgi:aspartate racemase
MQTLGLIGGMGPESTIAYYRKLVQDVYAVSKPPAYPNIIVVSIDMFRMLSLIETRAFDPLADFLALAVRKATRAGASFGAIAACTPHIVFQQVQSRCSIPLISIIDATVDHAIQRGFTTLGLVGSRFTMQGDFFVTAFAKRGVRVVTPSAADQEFIHTRYFSELVKGIVRPETRDAFNKIFVEMRQQHQIEAVVLAGTELALLYEDPKGLDIPVLDTTPIHIQCLVDQLLEDADSGLSITGRESDK